MEQDIGNELQKLRDERQKKFSEEDWEGALEVHDRILALSPNALRHANRGSILYRLGRLEDAIESYQKALDMDSTLKKARGDLERIEAQLQQQKSKEEPEPAEEPKPPKNPYQTNATGALSVSELAQARENDQDKEKRQMLSNFRSKRQECLAAEDWEGALEHHNQILEMEPTAIRYANQGSILYRLGNFPAAIQSYKTALEMNPALDHVKVDLQNLESQLEEEELLGQSKSEEPEKAQEATNIHTQVEEFRKQRQAHISAGEWEDALRCHEEILKLDPTALRYANHGALLYRIGRLSEALDSYDKALELDPSLDKIKEDKAKLEAQIEEESLMAHQEAEKDEEREQQIQALRKRRQQHLAKKEWDEGLALHDEILKLEPTALRYANRGSMLYHMGRTEEAINSYRKALEMDPNLEKAQIDLTRLEKELIQASHQLPSSPEEVAEKMNELKQRRQEMIAAEKWEDAIKAQEDILDLEPNAMRYANLGSLYYRTGYVESSINAYRHALDIDPSLDRAKEDLERIKEAEMDQLRKKRQQEMESENWEQALAIHDAILGLEKTALRYANRGSILYKLQRLPEAILSYKTALEMDPKLEKAREELAIIEEQLQDAPVLMAVPEEFEDAEEDHIFEEDVMEAEIAEAVIAEPLPDEDSAEAIAVEEEEVAQPVAAGDLSGHSAAITHICLSKDQSSLISSSKDKSVKVWSLEANNCLHTLNGHEDWVRDIYVSESNKHIVSASDDWNLKIWDLETGSCSATLTGHTMPVNNVFISKNERFVLSASRDQTIRVWDLTGKDIQTLKGHEDWVSCVAMNNAGTKVVSASNDNTIRIWNVLGWRCTKVIEGHSGWVDKIKVSHDGNTIVSLSRDKTVGIWTMSGESIAYLSEHNDAVKDIDLSEDGLLVATAGRDQCIHLWNTESGSLQKTFHGNLTRFDRVAISPDSKYLVASGSDYKVWLWDIESGKSLAVWNEDSRVTSNFLFIADQKTIFAGREDGKIQNWKFA